MGSVSEPTDQGVAEAIERFQAAGLGEGSWIEALEGLAGLTGSVGGELIGLGAQAAVPFNWMTGIDPAAPMEFLAAGGGDPRVNSRVRIGGAAPELTVLDESAFTSEEDGRRFPEYGAWMRRHDLNFICLSPLLRRDDLLVGLAVMRTQRQHNVSAVQRRAFAAVAPHVRAAVRTQMAIEDQGVALLTNLLDAMAVAAFVCDGFGAVRALSPRAEQLVADGIWLRLRRGRLSTRREEDMPAFRAALTAAASGFPAPSPVVARDAEGQRPLLLEATAIPGPQALRFGASALLIARIPREDDARTAEVARALYGLTPAEAAIAAALAAGRGPQAIAEANGVSVGTVRTHIRHIYEKAGVRSQIELLAALSRV